MQDESSRDGLQTDGERLGETMVLALRRLDESGRLSEAMDRALRRFDEEPPREDLRTMLNRVERLVKELGEEIHGLRAEVRQLREDASNGYSTPTA